jgi:hypothetical protein
MKRGTLILVISLATLALSIINLQKLKRMENNEERLLRLLEDLNLATNEVATDLEVLSTQIKSGSVTRASLDKLEETINRLKDLGKLNDDTTTTTTQAPVEPTTTQPQEDVTTTTTTVPPGEADNGNPV